MEQKRLINRHLLRLMLIGTPNIPHYHSLYSILDFDWLIHLQITACKYRSAANNWCKYCTEHAHFENASSASIKKSFFQNVNMARFAELSESELIVHYTRRKGCRKHQKSN